jgi:hypothetical protein
MENEPQSHDSPDGDDPLAENGGHSTTTWAIRNPLKDVQTPRACSKKTLTDAVKAAHDTKRQLNRANAVALQADLNAFTLQCDGRVLELAKRYSKKPSYIQLMLTNMTHYKKSRAPSLQNALIHHKSIEVNEGVPFFVSFLDKF